jgi:hypothetical protein
MKQIEVNGIKGYFYTEEQHDSVNKLKDLVPVCLDTIQECQDFLEELK